MYNLKKLSLDILVEDLKVRVKSERAITAEIIEYIREIDCRRGYLHYGATSLFSFLTEFIGYSKSSAQRRIEAARLSIEVDGVQDAIKAGTINLSQVSLLAQAIKQKQRQASHQAIKVTVKQKQELIEKMKSLSRKM